MLAAARATDGSAGRQTMVIGPWLHGGNKEAGKVGELMLPAQAEFPNGGFKVRHYLAQSCKIRPQLDGDG